MSDKLEYIYFKNVFILKNNEFIKIKDFLEESEYKNLDDINLYFNYLYYIDYAYNKNLDDLVILNKDFEINKVFTKLPNDYDIINVNNFGYIFNVKSLKNIIETIDNNKVKTFKNVIYSKKHKIYFYNAETKKIEKSLNLKIDDCNIFELKLKQNEVEIFNIPLYWINLNRSIFRRKFFKTFVEPYFKKSYMITGIDGYEEKNKIDYDKYKSYCSQGEFGCIKSHELVSKKILENNEKLSLVTEDDIFINYEYLKEKSFKLDSFPKESEILQLTTSNINKYKGFRYLWNNWDERHWSTGSYLIKNSGARKIVASKEYKLSNKNKILADHHLFKICKTYTYKFPLFFINIYNSSIINDKNKVELNAIKYFEKLINNFKENKTEKIKNYSQLNQDLNVLNFFSKKEKLFFVDIGANDGISLSNTYLLEKDYEWNGICSEPLPSAFNKLTKIRNVICDNNAVFSKSNLDIEFSESSLLSGITSELKGRHKNMVLKNNSTIIVKTITLQDLLVKYNAPNTIHYLSLDTEGSELEILKSVNFNKYKFLYINVEHNYIEPIRSNIRNLLLKNGYIYKCSNEFDDDYIHESTILGKYYFCDNYDKPILIEKVNQNNFKVTSPYWDSCKCYFDSSVSRIIFNNRFKPAKLYYDYLDFGNNNIWHRVRREKIQANIKKKLHFLCMVDKEGLKKGTVDNLRKSLNNDLIILDTYDMNLQNLSQIFKMKEFLDNDTIIKDDDLICFIDANDVIWLPNKKKQDLINLFMKQKVDLLFGAEIACAKHDKDVKNYFNEKYKNKKFKYLNGGFILGYKSKYHFMINDLVKYFEKEYFTQIKLKRTGPWINSYSNQRIYSRFMLKNETKKYMKIELDCDRKFVWNQSPTLSEQPFDINKVNTFFFHVTFLKGELQMKIYKEAVNFFLINNCKKTTYTIKGKKDGFGAQYQSIMSGIAHCIHMNYEYIHTPFIYLAHKANINLMNQFIGIPSSKSNNKINIIEPYSKIVHYSKNPSKYYDKNVLKLLRKYYYSTEKPKIEIIDIAIHIRRGDVHSEMKDRYTSNMSYNKIIKYLNETYPNKKIFIFSEGKIEDFNDINGINIIFKLNLEITKTFHSLVEAKILVTAKSSFSYSAAILNSNKIYYLKNFICKPLNHWEIIDY